MDGLEFGRQLVLVAIFLQRVTEVEALHELVALGRDLIHHDVLGPTEVRIDALLVLGGKGNLHVGLLD